MDEIDTSSLKAHLERPSIASLVAEANDIWDDSSKANRSSKENNGSNEEDSQQMHQAAEVLLEIKKQCEDSGVASGAASNGKASVENEDDYDESVKKNANSVILNRQNYDVDEHQSDDDEEKNVLRQLQNNDESENEGMNLHLI